MELYAGEISLCLNVADIHRSLSYYEKLGFKRCGGKLDEGWAILKYRRFELGLFQGHIDSNLLNFRGGDPLILERELRTRGLEPDSAAYIEPDTSQTLYLTDPDGNRIYYNSFAEEIAAYQRSQTGLSMLSEVIVYVSDMAAQVSFYRDILGLKVTYPPASESYASEYWVTFATGDCTLALHGGGQKRFGPDAPKLVFAVKDVAVERKRLLSLGVPLGEVRSPAPGVLVCDGVDPEGNQFSIEARS